ncbi:MAG: type II secretion system protein [Candidatus Saccharicenans sp.]|nr:type II secretion system protein [Candidatus Saccharicenans sp.]
MKLKGKSGEKAKINPGFIPRSFSKTDAGSDCSRERARGFSLVETIIAMGIIFFLLAGTVELLSYSLLLKHRSELHRVSGEIIFSRLEWFKSLDYQHQALTPGVHQETVKASGSELLFLLTWEVEEEDGVKKIRMSLYQKPSGSRPPIRVFWLKSPEPFF